MKTLQILCKFFTYRFVGGWGWGGWVGGVGVGGGWVVKLVGICPPPPPPTPPTPPPPPPPPPTPPPPHTPPHTHTHTHTTPTPHKPLSHLVPGSLYLPASMKECPLPQVFTPLHIFQDHYRTLGTLVMSATADVINHNRHKVSRFKPCRFDRKTCLDQPGILHNKYSS